MFPDNTVLINFAIINRMDLWKGWRTETANGAQPFPVTAQSQRGIRD